MNLDQIRRDTPSCNDRIFMNSAGASLSPYIVVDTIKEYLDEEQIDGGYKTADLRAGDIMEFYSELGRFLNCSPNNVGFAYNATDAYARALSCIPFKAGDAVLTTDEDYVSNQIALFSLQRRFGIRLVRAGNLANGDLDLQDFEDKLKKEKPVLVSVTHIPTNSGKIQPVEEVGKLCKKYNTWFLLDACQSLGQIPVDVQAIGCDFLTATGRKFMRGPRGTGFIYVSDRVLEAGLEPLFIDMRAADWTSADAYTMNKGARIFELFEIPYALMLGLTKAIRYANHVGMHEIYNYNQKLSARLRENLGLIPGLRLTDEGSRLSNIVTFHVTNMQPETITKALDKEHVYYSVSRKKNAFIDFDKKGIDWAIRLSPHYFNTLEEVEEVSHITSVSIGNQITA